MGFGQNILCGMDSAIETKEVSLSVPKEDRNVVMFLDLPKNCAYEKKSNVMGDILVIFQRLDFKKIKFSISSEHLPSQSLSKSRSFSIMLKGFMPNS